MLNPKAGNNLPTINAASKDPLFSITKQKLPSDLFEL